MTALDEIYSLRLRARTIGLTASEEKRFRELMNAQEQIGQREARLAEIERRLAEPIKTPAALVAFLRA